MQGDAVTISGTQARIITITVFHNQAELGSCTLLVLAIAAAQSGHYRSCALGKTSWADVRPLVGNAIKYR